MTAPSPISKLQPSKLTNQLELLRDDIDLSSLNLGVKGRASFHLLESITDAQVSRTIDGASTITLTVNDRDLTLLRSGVFGDSLTLSRHEKTVLGQGVGFARPFDIEIDGLWFRGVGVKKTGRILTLTFEDREVALLRSYPRKGTKFALKKRVVPATTMPRARFMEMLVRDVKETKIRLVCPMLGDAASVITVADAKTTETYKRVTHQPGLPTVNDITVKHARATPKQIDVIEAVLAEGVRQKVLRKLLVTAIMTITQESEAGQNVGNDPSAVGLFQQNPVWWPATGDPTTDSAEFYKRAAFLNNKNPSIDDADLAQAVQNSAFPKAYGQWRSEAENTVKVYLGLDDPTTPGDNPYVVPKGPLPDISGSFVQGKAVVENGKTVFVREDNWRCLQRLAQEVGWRCYCVSGTIYIETDGHLWSQKIQYTFNEDEPGIDSVDFTVDTGRANASVTVECRASRWQAAPGNVVAVKDMGPASGRWLVNQIDRSLFNPATTIMLKKEQPALPDAESADPIQSSGADMFAPGGLSAVSSALRDDLVAAAQKALKLKANFVWGLEPRPMPKSLWLGTPEHPEELDCSSFVTLIYKAAGATDPNGFAFSGSGNTDTLVKNGTNTTSPARGDLAFYGPDWKHSSHVALYIGDNKVISLGGPKGVIELDLKYRDDYLGILTYPGSDFLNQPAGAKPPKVSV